MLVRTPEAMLRRPKPGVVRTHGGTLLQRLALIALALAAWQVGALHAPSFVLPSPARVWTAWTGLVATPSFAADLGITSAASPRASRSPPSRPAARPRAGRKPGARRVLRAGAHGDEHGLVGDLGDLRADLVRAVELDHDLRGVHDRDAADPDQCLAGHPDGQRRAS